MYRAFTFKVLKKTENRDRKIMVTDHSHDEKQAFPYPEEGQEGREPKELVKEFLASKGIKVVKNHTWVEPHGFTYLAGNVTKSIKD